MSQDNALANDEFESFRYPDHWQFRRAGLLFRRVSEPNLDDLPVLSVSIHDGISDRQLEDDERDRKVNLISDRSSYQRVRPGYLAYNMMRAWQGAVGISNVEGAVSPAYVVAKPEGNFHSKYYEYLLRSRYFIEKMRQGSKGIADFRRRLYWEQFKEIELPLPPVSEQISIASYLDRETARIDQLIRKKEGIAKLISASWDALIHDARKDKSTKWVQFKRVASRVQRAIGDTDDAAFVPLGLYNRGRGFFKKTETDEDELGASSFFWVRKGDIVFSGQFAWEGAVGYVSDDEDGCVVSHRYPVYRADHDVEGAYLYAFFRTAHGAFLMENCSRGAAGRNRPLNTWSIEREHVLIPSKEIQKEIAQLVALEAKARVLISDYINKALELRFALVTAAVSGQLETSENCYIPVNQSDRAKFRAFVGAEIIHRHKGNLKFGRVKLQKELYLAEAHAGISELDGRYFREAAGPFDRTMMDETERALEAEGFYRAQQPEGNGGAVTYTPLAQAGRHAEALKTLLGSRADALRNLIALLSDLDRRQVEAVATLYAVWNDALMEDQQPDEAMIINGVLTDWHAVKGEKFTDADLRHWLRWMKRNGLVPRGEGPRTAHTMTRDMFS